MKLDLEEAIRILKSGKILKVNDQYGTIFYKDINNNIFASNEQKGTYKEACYFCFKVNISIEDIEIVDVA